MAQINIRDMIPDFSVLEEKSEEAGDRYPGFQQEDELPETWVNFHEFVRHRTIVRKAELPDSSLIVRMSGPQQPALPEAKLTRQQALMEIYTPLHRPGVVRKRLDQMIAHYRREASAGLISQQEVQDFQRILESIRQEYLIHTENTVDWFIDHYFRIFMDPFEEELDDD